MSVADQLEAVKKTLEEAERKMGAVNIQVSRLKKELEELEALAKKPSMEILDHDAPNAFKKWTPFEKAHLREKVEGFIYEQAKQQGRSTSAIKYKIAEQIVDSIAPEDWLKIGGLIKIF
jgi:hypothetical protein